MARKPATAKKADLSAAKRKTARKPIEKAKAESKDCTPWSAHDWKLDGSGGAVCQKCGGLVTVPSEVMRLLRERDKSKAAEVA